MSDAWDEIQAIKSKRNSLREKLEKRKKERQDILIGTKQHLLSVTQNIVDLNNSRVKIDLIDDSIITIKVDIDLDSDIEKTTIQLLSSNAILLPINSVQLATKIEKFLERCINRESIHYILKKLASQSIVSIKNVTIQGEIGYELILVDHNALLSLYNELMNDNTFSKIGKDFKRKYDSEEDDDDYSRKFFKSDKRIINCKESSNDASDLMSLLSMPSTREKQSKQVGEEILELLTKPTAKERSLAEKFKSHGGAQVMEFCPHGTRIECLRAQQTAAEMKQQQRQQSSSSSSTNNNGRDNNSHNNSRKSSTHTINTSNYGGGDDGDNEFSGGDDDVDNNDDNDLDNSNGGNINNDNETDDEDNNICGNNDDIDDNDADNDNNNCKNLNRCIGKTHQNSNDNNDNYSINDEGVENITENGDDDVDNINDDDDGDGDDDDDEGIDDDGVNDIDDENNSKDNQNETTTAAIIRNRIYTNKCKKLHFKKIIQAHTDESLGDCSFLNTCFHMTTCKYVHYEVDMSSNSSGSSRHDDIKSYSNTLVKRTTDPSATLYPPQWIQCDLRYLDMTVLGKFAVVMADPPWDIHMELPYGTMSDDEMRQLGVPALQDDGLIFLWVTGRAMELGRECLKLWGYERVDELIWVKTNQLQRIIRTGRTGHWLNHGKEHCLVGMKGNPKNLNRGLDCDVIVAEVRATSHKPDEIYGIIERLSPGTRKIELFGRPHNVQPNWITLGNQLDGIRLVDPELIAQFQKRYPDGNCMAPTSTTKK